MSSGLEIPSSLPTRCGADSLLKPRTKTKVSRKRNRGSAGLQSSRRSVAYYLDLLTPEERRVVERRRPSAEREFYPSMLIQDVENSIVPFREEVNGRVFRARLPGASANVQE